MLLISAKAGKRQEVVALSTKRQLPTVWILSMKSEQHYTVTKDADRLAPNWLAMRINYKTIKFIYRNNDGHAELKGVKIGDEVAQIGDTVQFNGRRLSVGRR